MFRRSFLGCALTITATVAIISSARADTLQNTTAQASSAQLTAAGFGGLNGTGVNVGVVEAGDSFANAYYNDGLENNPGDVGSASMALPEGNPDLPGSSIDFVQLPSGALPTEFPVPPPDFFPYPVNEYQIGNHATEVTGVVIGQGTTAAADLGIAPKAGVTFAALDGANNVYDISGDSSGTNAGASDAAGAVQQVLQARNTPIVNMSWGYTYSDSTRVAAGGNKVTPFGFVQATNGANQPLYLLNIAAGTTTTNPALAATYGSGANATPVPIIALQTAAGLANNIPKALNNGSALLSKAIDYEAIYYDATLVVAGNEGPNVTNIPTAGQGYFSSLSGLSTEVGSPSDSYNVINVGAAGQRGSFVDFAFQPNATDPLYYGVASTYNTPNMTSDVSPITGYGRLKTDLVAPGGDPAARTGTAATNLANGLAFANQFQTTAGGVTPLDKNGDPVESDTYNGQEGYQDVTTTSNYFVTTTNVVTPTGLAGTSYAAPLVSGAASLLYQQFTLNPVALSSDHRVMKAILLNGASHFYDGQQLFRQDGQTPWSRLPGKGFTPLPAGTTAGQFGGSGLTVRPGLDPELGTGMLNVTASLQNYVAGRQGPGLVNPTGWDLNTVPNGTAANIITGAYTIRVPISGIFSATLAWDDPINIDDAGDLGTVANGSTFSRGTLTDLDLYLFKVNPNGSLGQNVDFSTSDIDNVEYLYDDLASGMYQLDVVNAQFVTTQDTTYGLAWSTVPEPASICLMVLGGIALAWAYRRQRALTAASFNV